MIDLTPFKHLYPFDSHFLSVNGWKYHYLDEGRGEPVVMLHGNPTWSFYYRNLVQGLSDSFRAIVPDHIGCGLSEKPSPKHYGYRLENRVDDLECFLDKLGLRDGITLVVHDWGGMIGMAYAARHPGRIRRIVVMNTAAFLKPHGKNLPIRLKIIRNLRAFAVPAVLGMNLFARGALIMAPGKKLEKDVKKGLIAPYNTWKNRMATLKFVQDIPLVKTDPSYALAEETEKKLPLLSHVPMLILWGRHDFVFDRSYLSLWRQRFPEAEVHLFEKAGHYILEDEWRNILPIIRKFLRKNPGPKDRTKEN
mgnify:FL=1